MVNTKALKLKISKSNKTIVGISNELGISREGFYKKLNGETEFKASEIVKLSKALKMNNNERDLIFFDTIVN